MRPSDGIDAVDLDEADPLDQVLQGLPRGRARGRFGQGVTVKKQAAGAGVQDQLWHLQAVSLQSVSTKVGNVTKSFVPSGCKPRISAYLSLIHI